MEPEPEVTLSAEILDEVSAELTECRDELRRSQSELVQVMKQVGRLRSACSAVLRELDAGQVSEFTRKHLKEVLQ
jgi:hypothetical protein